MGSVQPIRASQAPFTAAPDLPVARLLIGKPVAEAADLLPRVYNLCRAAQDLAGRLALGLEPLPEARADLLAEIRRDHFRLLFLVLPGFLGLPQRLPARWQDDSPELRAALFGNTGCLPGHPDDMDAFLRAGNGIAPLLSSLRKVFAPGEAASRPLPPVDPQRAFRLAPVENSPAARHAAHPVMAAIAGRDGYGPLWRATGMAYDLQACLDGTIPAAATPAPGQAIVPAARGTYAVTAQVRNGRVADLVRLTPTDHMLFPRGMLDTALARLPADRQHLGSLVLTLMNPCRAVTLREVQHA